MITLSASKDWQETAAHTNKHSLMLRKVLCGMALLCIPFIGAFSQKQIIYKADWSYSDPQNKDILILVGNVEFQHDGAVMYCDSAELNVSSDVFHAFSSVRLIMDTIEVSGEELCYSGISKIASMQGDEVVLQDKNTFLYTRTLNYDRKTNTAYYPSFGTIKDSTGVMTAQHGEYNTETDIFHFWGDVNIKTSSAVLYSDTLEYNSNSHVATFFGNTDVFYNDSTHIFSPRGQYNTSTGEAWGRKGSVISNKQYRITADSLHYSSRQERMQAFCNVVIKDTVEKATITGHYAQKDEQQQRTFITDSVFLRYPYNHDTLFLSADTLFLIKDSSGSENMAAFHRVRMFHIDMQGVCDSMVYQKTDSLLTFFSQPLLWAEQNQISADTIKMRIGNKQIRHINFLGKPIMIQHADTLSEYRFNQMTGKFMTAFFQDGKLHRLDIDLNAESVYYLFEEEQKGGKLMGVNIGQSSTMTVVIKNNEPWQITARNNPSFFMDREEKLDKSQLFLKHFRWLPKKRPHSPQSIFSSPSHP